MYTRRCYSRPTHIGRNLCATEGSNQRTFNEDIYNAYKLLEGRDGPLYIFSFKLYLTRDKIKIHLRKSTFKIRDSNKLTIQYPQKTIRYGTFYTPIAFFGSAARPRPIPRDRATPSPSETQRLTHFLRARARASLFRIILRFAPRDRARRARRVSLLPLGSGKLREKYGGECIDQGIYTYIGVWINFAVKVAVGWVGLEVEWRMWHRKYS